VTGKAAVSAASTAAAGDVVVAVRDVHYAAGGRPIFAGLDLEVLFTPGHSPGHITYAISAGAAPVLLSGDVLFQGSVGRVDLPGGDWPTLERSIGSLLDAFAEDTVVYPGHMGVTSLGRERLTNPFLRELALSKASVQRAG